MEIQFINDIEVLVNIEEKHLQVNDLNEEGIASIWENLVENYSGFNAMFCYHNVGAPVNKLESLDITLVDDSTEMRLTPVELTNAVQLNAEIKTDDGSFDIHLVDHEKFDDFAKFHDAKNPDMYWSSTRVRDNLGIWRIHTYSVGGKIVGYIMIMNDFEVVCSFITNELQGKRLMAVAAADAFIRGSNQLMYMLDNSDQANLHAAAGIGFVSCGFYHGYKGCISGEK